MESDERLTIEQIVEELARRDALPGLPPANGSAAERRLRERLLGSHGGIDGYKREVAGQMRARLKKIGRCAQAKGSRRDRRSRLTPTGVGRR